MRQGSGELPKAWPLMVKALEPSPTRLPAEEEMWPWIMQQ